ncbi:MAG TPA: polysaccharide deacetylase family protein [Candidatus Anoxymicrobiaceae bacterium]
MKVRSVVVSALAAFLVALALVTAAGCVQTTGASAPAHFVFPDLKPALAAWRASLPRWKLEDRNALATSLGWGQVSRGKTTSKRIALTFDAGADAGATAKILDTLKDAELHCTFFITGQFATQYPDLVKRLAAEGHELGNHSWSHPHFPELTQAQVSSEVTRTELAVKKLTGLDTKPYFRFPYGAGSTALVKQLNSMGYIGVLWTFDTLDSEGAKADEIRSRVAKYAVPGAICLMHCGSTEESTALPGVISDLQNSGYKIVTLTEVLLPDAK